MFLILSWGLQVRLGINRTGSAVAGLFVDHIRRGSNGHQSIRNLIRVNVNNLDDLDYQSDANYFPSPLISAPLV